MKVKPTNIILLIFLLSSINFASSPEKGRSLRSNPYFPINTNKTLVYQSSFGDCITKYYNHDECTVSSSEGSKFKYKQTMVIKEDGVYVKETYQFLKVLLLIKKEVNYTYGKPLLRFPVPLLPGMVWSWEGDEYSEGVTNKVTLTGKALKKEFVYTHAGKFEAIKIESVIVSSANTKNTVTEWFAEGVGLIKAKIVIEGGGLMGTLRDFLGYGTIEFELKEIKQN